MKSATRVTSKGQGTKRTTPSSMISTASELKAEDSIEALYGCLKDLSGDPLADHEAEHRAEIAADRAIPSLATLI